MANIKNILKKLTGEQLIEAGSFVMDGDRPNMAHLREATHAKPWASLECIFLCQCWDALKTGKGKDLVKIFTDSYVEWAAKRKADLKAGKEAPELETVATYALADVVSILAEGWEMCWSEAHKGGQIAN